ncbi:filamentous hemagglutinin N-terminal domain-containing protein [Providencia rettgeri]|nr:filamentous hemagglutinin N-terminal domain-containing protein [Providencia rettgeri]
MSQPIKNKSYTPTLKLKPIVLCVSAILGVSFVAHAEIINTNGAGVMNQSNGPTIVHINKASDKGVSHNIYSKFDVDNKGVILNNSKNNVNTQLGGLINGNLNLSGGEASVILNEVNSNNATTLNGMIEVAGKKAQVIVANPSGITCNTCGFINTESATLTTGNPLVSNGELLGYNVAKGQIIVNKNLTSDSPTELISRSVFINGKLNAEEIKVVTGNNFVDAKGNAVSSIAGTGNKPSVGIDVSALGGMYADKITLVSTESGVGVRNRGVISAGNKGLSINTDGFLTNYNNKIESSGNININTNTFTNTALITAKNDLNIITNETNDDPLAFDNNKGHLISTAGDINLQSKNRILNRYDSLISAKNNINIKTKDIHNEEGLIKAETGDVNIDARGAVYQWRGNYNSKPQDRLIAGRDVNITAHSITNEKAKIESGRDVNLTITSDVKNTNSVITAKRKINIEADTLTNNSSSITSTNAKSDLNIAQYITNDANSVISSGRGLNITSAKLTNTGKIISPTNVPNTPPVPTYVSNLKVGFLNNKGGSISGDTLNITSNSIHNGEGFIDAKNLRIDANYLDNYGGYIRSYGNIVLNTNILDNSHSSLFSKVSSKFGLTNKTGGIETLNGGITVTGDNIYNEIGVFKSAAEERTANVGGMEFNLSGTFKNYLGELISDSNITVDANNFYNYKGKVNSGGGLKIKSAEAINNSYGKLNSQYVTEIYTPSIFTDHNDQKTYSTDGTGIIYNPNGLNIVHIKKPTNKGISHNTYQSFNVGEKGIIFNNSSSMTTTQLGGNIVGNENITAGKEATVILNEVVGNNISLINGMMEVAGTAAQVIVANASGITCNSCGFINASRGAFVTGTPLVVGDNLIGYNVNKGQITVNKNLTSNNAVDFIARSVLINGDVKANELNISTGYNLFDQSGNVLSSLSGYYNQNHYGVTVASGGSLTAEKMNINVNESERFLSNYGLISTGNGGLTVNGSGIRNSGMIQAKGNIDLTSTSRFSFDNDKGNIISSAGNISINSNGGLTNRYNGLISANNNINLNISGDIHNEGGLIKAVKGDINASADTIHNRADSRSIHGKNRFIAGQDINFTGDRIYNEQAIISAGRDFSFTGHTIENKSSSTIQANRRVTIDSDIINNLSSVIQAVTGRMDITAQKEITNDTRGVISSDKLMNITSPKLTNSGIIISNNGKSTFKVDNLTNKSGYIKGFNLNFISKYLTNSSGLIKADNNLVMNADYISNTNSSDFSKNTYYLGLPSQKGGIVANNGNIKLKGVQLNNASGMIQTNAIFPAAGQADIDITMDNEINNNYSQINSTGNLNASANRISNYDGIMSAGLDLTAKADDSIYNYYGKISSGNTTKLITPNLNNNNGKITGYPVIIENN